jgi:hypothetical protein
MRTGGYMKDEIKELKLGEKGKSAWVIHQRKMPAAVCVTFNEGDILLHTEDVYHWILTSEAIRCIRLDESARPFRMYVDYVCRKGLRDQSEKSLLLGCSEDVNLLPLARQFVDSLNSAFYQK